MNNIIVIRKHTPPTNSTLGGWQACILDMEKLYPDNFIYGIWEYTRELALEACLGKAAMMDIKYKSS